MPQKPSRSYFAELLTYTQEDLNLGPGVIPVIIVQIGMGDIPGFDIFQVALGFVDQEIENMVVSSSYTSLACPSAIAPMAR